MKSIFILLFTLSSIFSFGQEDLWKTQNIEKHFLIAASTTNYKSALKTVRKLTSSINMKFDQRGLYPIDQSGLTWRKSVCEGDGWEHPCYLARGREDGNYLSIEWSNAIEGFTKGYYVVIVSCQLERNDEMKALLAEVKTFIPSAYIKSSKVYLGCMH